MESAVACTGIWAFYFLLRLLDLPNKRNGLLLGVVWGVGFFIKSSAALFIIPSVLILLHRLVTENREKTLSLVKTYSLSLLGFFGITYFIFVQPYYWSTLSTNTRYTYSLTELLSFPVLEWLSHLWGAIEISGIFMTPLIVLWAVVGGWMMWRKKTFHHQSFLLYFVLALLLEIVLGKTQSQRYVLPFLPFFTIPSAYLLSLCWQSHLLKKILVAITVGIPALVSLLVILKPEEYIFQSARLSRYADTFHIHGQTSGHGIAEAIEYIKSYSSEDEIVLVFFALNTGNPENAIDLYTQQSANLYGLFLDASFIPQLDRYRCLSSEYPSFFVTRSEQQAGLNAFFELTASFPNPDPSYSVNIFTLKTNCEGETISLSELYQPAVDKMKLTKPRH
jgi:hypothetical protein